MERQFNRGAGIAWVSGELLPCRMPATALPSRTRFRYSSLRARRSDTLSWAFEQCQGLLRQGPRAT